METVDFDQTKMSTVRELIAQGQPFVATAQVVDPDTRQWIGVRVKGLGRERVVGFIDELLVNRLQTQIQETQERLNKLQAEYNRVVNG